MPTDKRGKNKSGNKKSIEICSKIHDYIESFNVRETVVNQRSNLTPVEMLKLCMKCSFQIMRT